MAAFAVVVLVDGDDGPPAEGLVPIEVPVADVEATWNGVIDDLGAGDALGAPSWDLDDALDLEVFEQPFGSWGLLEVYRAPGGDVAALHLVGTYVGDDDRSRFRANATAAVAAALDLDAGSAAALLDDELELRDSDTNGSRTVERRGGQLTLTRAGTTAELRITGS